MVVPHSRMLLFVCLFVCVNVWECVCVFLCMGVESLPSGTCNCKPVRPTVKKTHTLFHAHTLQHTLKHTRIKKAYSLLSKEL